MDLKKTFFVLVSYMYLNYSEAFEHQVCFNDKIEVYECCQDFRNVSGKCEACIGSWGFKCRNNCSFGYYGFGCRQKCNCNYHHTCHPIQGCIEAPLSTTPDLDLDDLTNTEASLLVASGLLILLLLCVLLICYKKMKKQSKPIQRCAGQKVMYDDLRVSRIVDNGGEYDIPACIDNSNKQIE
uniref:Uncharacterized protein n=1 Tax=Magallana gigas TaxID=29159 RepID=A0A8W8K3Q6_MAGGI